MPFYRMHGAMVHIQLSGKGSKNPPAPCRAPIKLDGRMVCCCAISTLLCDWPMGEGQTCDMPLCDEHGHQVAADRHLCPNHRAEVERLRLEPLALVAPNVEGNAGLARTEDR